MTTEAESFFCKPASWFEPLDWEKVFAPLSDGQPAFPSKSEVHVDLGAGDGGFLIARAKRLPEVRFLGVERLLGRARKIARRAFREPLHNVRVARIEAAYAAEWLFPPGSVDVITILFPDPWPKRRHHHHRLVQTAFLDHCARSLKPGGWLAIKTDDQPYFAHIRETLEKSTSLAEWTEVRAEDLLPETTDFEREFAKEQRAFYFIAARRTQPSS